MTDDRSSGTENPPPGEVDQAPESPSFLERPERRPIIPTAGEHRPILTTDVQSKVIPSGPAAPAAAPPAEAAPTPPVAEQAPPRVSFFDALQRRDDAAIAEGLERAARLLLAASVFLVAVVFDPRTVDAFNLTKITVLWVVDVIAFGLALAASAFGAVPWRSRLRDSAIVKWSLALLAVTTLATVFSVSRSLSFFGLYHRYQGLVSLALLVGLLLLIVGLYRGRPDALSEIVVAVGLAGGVVGLYVTLQHAHLDPWPWHLVSGSVPSFPIGNLGNSEFSGAFLGMAVPFVLYLIVRASPIAWRIVWSAVFVFVIAGLIWTQARSGMLAGLAGAAALVLFLSHLAARRKVALVAVALVGLLGLSVLLGSRGQLATQSGAHTNVRSLQSLQYRMHLWDAAWHMFLNRPILGWGPETTFGLYPRFRTATDARVNGLTIPDKPHSIYLDWAVSAGLVGLVAFLALVGLALLEVGRRAQSFPRSRRLLMATFGAGLVAYLVQGVFSIDVPPLALVAWTGLAGIAALTLEPNAEPDAAERSSGWWNLGGRVRPAWLAPVAAGLALLFLVVAGLRPLRADHAALAAQGRSTAGWSGDTMDLYQKAVNLNPHEAAYLGLEGSYLERIAGDPRAPFTPATALNRAATLYETAVDLQPRSIYFMINAARVYARLGNLGDMSSFTKGDQWLGSVATLDPLDPQVHDLYYDLLQQWAKKTTDPAARGQINQRALTQAAIARALRAGQIVR